MPSDSHFVLLLGAALYNEFLSLQRLRKLWLCRYVPEPVFLAVQPEPLIGLLQYDLVPSFFLQALLAELKCRIGCLAVPFLHFR